MKIKMKNLSKTVFKTVTLLFLIAFATQSCSSDDDVPSLPPTVNFTNSTIDAVFFNSGSSSVPNVNWNGNQGTFSYAPATTGLSIDENTGMLNWTNLLEEGTHNIQVIATNNNGQTSTDITLENPFQGTFIGTYSGSNFFRLIFNTDGTIRIETNDTTNPFIATGTWQLNGAVISADYTFDGGFDYSIKGTYIHTNSSVTISGDWYIGHGAISGSEAGVFEVTMD